MTQVSHDLSEQSIPELLICTRFGLRVRNPEWLEHRFTLLSSITAPSLLAQSDQRFHWIVLVDDGLPDDIRSRLEDLLRPFGQRGWLYQRKRHSPETLVQLAEDRVLSAQDRYLLTGRLDDDDAWATDMVGAVRVRAASWLAGDEPSPGLSFTFQDGLEWIMYDMLDVERMLSHQERLILASAIRRYSLPFIGTSVFVCSELSARATAMSGAHSRVAENLAARKGFATDVIKTEAPMWLCCRHKQAGSGIRKAQGPEAQLTLKDLAAQFGLDERKVQYYLDQADKYQYTIVKSPLTKKHDLIREWLRVTEQLQDPAVSAAERSDLQRRQDELAGEMTRLEENVLGDPGKIQPTAPNEF